MNWKNWLSGAGLAVSACLWLPVSASAMDISWNGFGSVYYGHAFTQQLLPAGFERHGAEFTNFSLMGLNLGASVSDELDFATQLVALGRSVGTSDSYGLIAQWAYVNYRPAENTSLKLGRQLYPVLMASEYVRVAYLMPFRQIPSVVFNLVPFTRFDGASVEQKIPTSFGSVSVGVFGGDPLLDVNSTLLSTQGFAFRFSQVIGTQLTVDGDGWRVRAQASRFFSQLSTSAPSPVSNKTAVQKEFSLGYRIDKRNFVSWGEIAIARSNNGTITPTGAYAKKGDAFYVLGGYRFGRFLPRYTFSRGQNEFNLGTPGSNGRTVIHSLGVNYQAGSQAVIKLDYEKLLIPSASGGGYFVIQPPGASKTSGHALYAGLDFIF